MSRPTLSMVVIAASVVGAAGCQQLLGLEAPSRRSDAAQLDDASVDMPLDAAEFAPDLCPASYTQSIQSSPASRYRLITTNAAFRPHHADCNDDRPGWTHLLVIDDMPEGVGAANLDPTPFKYIGAVQPPGQTTPIAGWLRFSGEPAITGWSTTGGGEPDDVDDAENGEQNLAMIQALGNMYDTSGGSDGLAICECDGKPIDPVVAAIIAALP